MRTIKPLDALLGSNRQKVLSRTHLQPDRWWYLHELARTLHLRPSSVQRELEVLVGAGVLTRRRHGNRVYIKAEPACPIFPEIRNLLVKTAGVVDVLKDALSSLAPKVQIAFVYGSIASSEERSTSDVDLMVIGSAGLSELSPPLRVAETLIGRSVNATVYRGKEFAEKLKLKNNFLHNVARSRKLLIIGNKDDLDGLIGQRTRQASQDKSSRDL